MTPEHIEHIALVHAWLDENVIEYPTPAKVTLSDFQVDWLNITGSFALALDEVHAPYRFKFALGDNGRLRYFMPMFHSPLGAPASYGAVEFTDETRQAISEGLCILVPRFASFGLHPITREFIHQSTPLAERVLDPEGVEMAKRLLSSSKFALTVGMQSRARAPTL
jgi:hypothetical protein